MLFGTLRVDLHVGDRRRWDGGRLTRLEVSFSLAD